MRLVSGVLHGSRVNCKTNRMQQTNIRYATLRNAYKIDHTSILDQLPVISPEAWSSVSITRIQNASKTPKDIQLQFSCSSNSFWTTHPDLFLGQWRVPSLCRRLLLYVQGSSNWRLGSELRRLLQLLSLWQQLHRVGTVRPRTRLRYNSERLRPGNLSPSGWRVP